MLSLTRTGAIAGVLPHARKPEGLRSQAPVSQRCSTAQIARAFSLNGPLSTKSCFLASKPLHHETDRMRKGDNMVVASGSFGGDDMQKEAYGLRRVVFLSAHTDTSMAVPFGKVEGRRISWISFWLQLALSIVSSIVLFFTATTASKGSFPQAPVFFNLGGVVFGFISTFLSYSRTRVARRVIESNEKVSSSKVAADVLGATRLNLFGMGLTLVGLQSTVGGLVGKALTSSSAGAYNVQSAQTAPAALDVFAVQASTNTILLHFLGIVFANWMLRVLNRDAKAAAPA